MRSGKWRNIVAAWGCAAAISLTACGGGGSGSNKSGSGGNSGSNSRNNTAAVVVNAGPNGNYANGLFTTVTICASGSSNCQSISGVLVDTGSFGLRILSSALASSLSGALAPVKNSGGSPVVECAQFSDGITWGPLVSADVKIGGEQASALPIQIIGSPAFSAVPSGCTSAGAPEDTLQALGTNGILGIGNFAQDCPACQPGSTNNPGLYYACAGSSCQVTTVSLSQQAQNPVAAFSGDNNGVVVELPAATSSEASLSGSLIFGIGTQSNNGLGSAHVYTVSPNNGNFSTSFQGKTYTDAAFLDTGSNGYFFLDSTTTGMPTCPSPANGFYCPASTMNLTATNIGMNNTSGTVSFSIANADTLFSSTNDTVFPTLGGPMPGMFDWGLPFFYGRNVYVAIAGAQTPGGAGPYWAY